MTDLWTAIFGAGPHSGPSAESMARAQYANMQAVAPIPMIDAAQCRNVFNDPVWQQAQSWMLANSLRARMFVSELAPIPLEAWLTVSPQPGIRWYRINNRTHRVEIRREG